MSLWAVEEFSHKSHIFAIFVRMLQAVDCYLGKCHKWCLVIGYIFVKTSQFCAFSQNT